MSIPVPAPEGHPEGPLPPDMPPAKGCLDTSCDRWHPLAEILYLSLYSHPLSRNFVVYSYLGEGISMP